MDEETRNEPEFELTAEAAANDGLATPFVFLGLFVAAEEGSGFLTEWVLADLLYATLAAAAIGVGGGYLIAAAFVRLRDGGYLDHAYDGWAGIAAALAIFALAEVVGAYGFVAAFAGGLGEPGLSGWLLAPILIVLIRPALVIATLAASPIARRDRLFRAWFGVKGVASLNYAAIAVGAGVLADDEMATVFWTAAACVVVSILAHGVSATAVSRRLLG